MLLRRLARVVLKAVASKASTVPVMTMRRVILGR